jgi:hypothetical protein
MDQYQRSLLDRALGSISLDYRQTNDELVMRCPICSPRYRNRHLTLALNVAKERWQCFRCARARGRDVKSFLLHLGLISYIKHFEQAKETYIDSLGLAEVRRRLLASPQEEETKTVQEAQFPEGYRTDFKSTITGRAIYGYLTKKRRLAPELIDELRVGYSVEGDCNGAAIFPVFMDHRLVFWQARRVLFQTNNKYHNPKLVKNILYGYDWIRGDSAYLVEGILDAIALKPLSIGLLGKTISKDQVALLAEKNIKTANVVLDGDAWENCQRLARTVREQLWTVKKVNAYRLKGKLDPGNFIGRRELFESKIIESRSF